MPEGAEGQGRQGQAKEAGNEIRSWGTACSLEYLWERHSIDQHA